MTKVEKIRNLGRAAAAMALVAAVLAGAAAAQNPFAAQMQAAAAGRALLTEPGLQVVLCGTSGPLYSPDRAGPCTVVIAGGRWYLVDAGGGALESLLRLNLPFADLAGVFVTHYHSDHMAELGEVNFAFWTRGAGTSPLRMWGPEGLDEVVSAFNQAYALDKGYRIAHHGEDIMPPAGAFATAHPFTFDAGTATKVVLEEGGLKVTAIRVDHPPIPVAVGYRFDFEGRSAVISGDTRRSPDLAAAARGADLLIHEAIGDAVVRLAAPALERAGNSRQATILTDALNNHTLPPDVFAVAAEAGVRMVVLSHLVPPLPAEQADRVYLQGRDAFAGRALVGQDGMRFVLPSGSEEIREDRVPGP